MKTIICATCGQEVVKTGRNQKYCPDCTDKANLTKKREYNERKRMEAAASVPRPDNHAELAMVAAEARRRGLTYGQMVAMGV